MESFQDRLAYARKKKGWTQSELADKLGLKSGKQTVYKWESGKGDPSMSQLIQIAEVLNTSVAWLVENNSDVSQSSVAPGTPAGFTLIPTDELIELQRQVIQTQQEELKRKQGE